MNGLVPEVRHSLRLGALPLFAVGGAGLIFGLNATLSAPYRPVLRRVTVPVPAHWPQVSILHLSDLHVQSVDHRLYRAQQRFLSSIEQSPDLVCVTGDICEQDVDAPRAAELLRLVRPRLATLLVLGNHEHDAPPLPGRRVHTSSFWRLAARLTGRLLGPRPHSSGTAEAERIAEILARAGNHVLLNEGARFDVGGRSLWVAGTDSVWSGRGRPGAALRGAAPGEPVLGLVHEPEGAVGLIAHGADLVLAGHTHGGQVVLPLIGAPVTWRVDTRIRVASGLQRLGSGRLHISAGLGHTTPLRFRCPPEATWIDCIPTDGDVHWLPTEQAARAGSPRELSLAA